MDRQVEIESAGICRENRDSKMRHKIDSSREAYQVKGSVAEEEEIEEPKMR